MRTLAVILLLWAAPPVAEEAFAQTAPEPLQVPFTAERILLDPGSSLRNRLMPADGTMPGGDVQFTVRCDVLVRDGRVGACGLPTGDPILAEIARDRARYYLFKIDDLVSAARKTKPKKRAAAAQPTFTVDIVEWVRPADRRVVDVSGVDHIARDQVRYRSQPDGEIVSGLYPIPALRQGAGARIAITCRVEEGLSLFCVDPEVQTGWQDMPEVIREQFKNAALAIASRIQVEPLLTDGRAAAGKVFDTGIAFVLP